MPKNRKTRLYTRQRGGVTRFYADLRSYTDVGGRREPLVAPGEKMATDDRTVAEVLLARRIEELEAKRHKRTLLGIQKETSLAPYAAYHLVEKKRSGRVTDTWLADSEMQLQRAVDFFGTERDLGSIGVAEVQAFVAHLLGLPNSRGATLSGGTVRHHLNCLSNLYRRAPAED